MSSIYEINGRWRAQLRSGKIRMSKVFDDRASAEAWAERKTLGLKVSKHRDGAISLVPRRVLAAMAAADFGPEHVVAGAIAAPAGCGVYFLIRLGEIVYIGKTTDVYLRLSKHRRDGKVFDAYNFMPCRPGQLEELESRYIAAFLPRGNMRL